ncbi:MAG: tRNA (guanosine(37)-N1)-methyltransferase TrmD [Lachnospiraceae bacterium]|nr:tRNA (guanosine(37)-N1)-methyltransferase TrmD [Lachnospiraceae bacterium]
MRFTVLTLFPEMVEQSFHTSILGRAAKKGLLSLRCINFREFSDGGKGYVDDYPYGGGAGMILQAPPIYRAYRAATGENPASKPRLVYMTPQGRVLDQALARELAEEEELYILCGHYEGVDERVLDEIATDRISIGDYVLTGGELPALVLMDAVARMVPGVLTNETSGGEESFMNGLLEYPQYTRPEIFLGREVPEVLKSGHHARIARWRRNESLRRTFQMRPDLLKTAPLDREDRDFLAGLDTE